MLTIPIPIIVFSTLGGLSPLISLYLVEKCFFRHAPEPQFLSLVLKTARGARHDIPWLLLSAIAFPLAAISSAMLNIVLGLQPELTFIASGPDALGWFLVIIIPVSFFPFLLTSPLFEEPGWRGYALTQLDKRMPWFFSDLIVGSYWFLWHQGMNLAFDILPSTYGYFAMLTDSFLIGAIFRKSGRNLLMAMFMHAGAFISITYLYSMEQNWCKILIEIGMIIILYAKCPREHTIHPVDKCLEPGDGFTQTFATRPSTDAARSSSFPPGTCIPTADANDA
ncbi:MAG: lysostaphin resistance A-like protein, partial [Candidatus Sigynarchaeota archaeon]